MTQSVPLLTPYSTARAFMPKALPDWMDEYDAQRTLSYQLYEQIYWNVPETFKLVARGSENNPIYIPTARTIIDTTNRHVAPNLSFAVDPDFGSPEEQDALRLVILQLFRRERFLSRFAGNKRYGMIRGDWAFHVVANPDKPQGRRISIHALDPGSMFKVTHPDDVDRVIAIHIIDQIVDGDKVRIRRQTYTKGEDPVNNDGSDTRIFNSIKILDVEKWQNLEADAVQVVKQPTELPLQITAIPIYHIPNKETPGDPYGSSQIRGFERIMAAVNQAVSDEELALALDGIGMYATDAGQPRDSQGKPTTWKLGPGRVVQLPSGANWDRVDGVGSVTPFQDHLKFLIDQLREASAVSDAVSGKVDVTVAESGVALALQMAPMIAEAEEKESIITDVLTQLTFDLKAWLLAYEGLGFPEAVVLPTYGDKMPMNRKAKVDEILSIVREKVASIEWGQKELVKLGYEFSSDEVLTMVGEVEAIAAASDPFAARASEELEDQGGSINV